MDDASEVTVIGYVPDTGGFLTRAVLTIPVGWQYIDKDASGNFVVCVAHPWQAIAPTG